MADTRTRESDTIETRAARYFGWGPWPRRTIKTDRHKVLILSQGRLGIYWERTRGEGYGEMVLLTDRQLETLLDEIRRLNR